MRDKLDTILFGIIVGLILPLLVLGGFYLSTYAYLQVPDFLRKLAFAETMVKILSLCAISNMGIFFLFYYKEMDKAARGVVFSTFLYAFGVVVYKLVNGTL
ncbi:hypothetical protein [Acidiluteibacter ferrifornacis]|uniref:Uncharacterized protein n=1 Tax=Acidiluteibacter ferrifornacis TaxID=2692424 RepID=A0A6N9NK76_9FLAO|nr:hypothetical protein [Acidiluteibacter ferrifornacis]MBR9833091.1 hypothetical protein [bacterium]NBG66259.1 hypothetical protein [Acidiluteibacter ferrifornacis]